MSQENRSEVVVERSITASVEQAYRAWTDPEEQSRWMFTRAEQDVRVGGHYSSSTGERGEYLEVEPNRRLRFTWEGPSQPPGSQVTVQFLPEASDVVIVRLVHSDIERAEDVAPLQDGWEWALDSFKSFLEAGQPLGYDDWYSRKEMGL
jgi:uncharacterized protein YndB with AHSA1/START domain